MATPTTDLEIANLALAKLGHGIPIVNLSTDTTTEAKAARQFIDIDRDRALCAFPWKWSEKRTILVPLLGQTHERWTYFYRIPSDWVPGTGKFYVGHPYPNPDAEAEFEAILTADGAGRCFACNISPLGATSPPLIQTATAVASGGTFAAGTYYWVVTAIGPQGESLASNEKSLTLVLNGSAVLAWTTVSGATSYRVYRGTTAGGEAVYYTTTALTYTDTNAASTGGTPPSTSAATDPAFFYTSRVTNVALYPQPFVDFFASLLAVDLLMPILRDNPRTEALRQHKMQEMQLAFREAVVSELKGMRPYQQPPTPSVRARS